MTNPVTLDHGTPTVFHITASAAISGGEVVSVGGKPMIARSPFRSGAVNCGVDCGGAVYVAVAGSSCSVGDLLYWDATNEKVTTSASGNALIGICEVGASAADEKVTFLHAPFLSVLPAASTTVLGGVKVDGTTITIADGVISATGTP